jgi:hypothetical protein
MAGDTYKRNFDGNVAQCGCMWVRRPEGDRLIECVFHHEATKASVAKFERERKERP